MINAPEVWEGFTGQNVVVAVVDLGVDYRHSDLNDNIWRNTGELAGSDIDADRNGFVDDTIGWNFSSDNNNSMDTNGHGAHVAGTIAAENNRTNITGAAYNAKIMSVRVLDSDSSRSNASVSTEIRYAANNGANVINLSLGGSDSSEVEQAIRYATERGAIVVMAARNETESTPGDPDSLATEFGIAVGAVDQVRLIKIETLPISQIERVAIAA
jgi:subtilisin family serine protease